MRGQRGLAGSGEALQFGHREGGEFRPRVGRGVTLDDARHKIALWRYDCNAVGPHSSPGNLRPLEARRTLAPPEGSAPGALARKPSADYQSQTGRLPL